MKLSDLIEIIGGGTPKTSVNEYWNGSIPWLSVKDFNNDERYVYETEKCITEEGLAHSSTKLLQKDDIIISARGTVGEIAMIPFPMAFNQSCYGIRGKKHLIDNTYLYYLIKNSIKSLKKITHGSVFDTITRDTFKNIEVNIPSINLQIKIAEILSTLDDKIELNNQINKNLEQQAQAIFKSWFIDFEPFGGVMPDDWKILILDDVSTINAGGDKPNIVYSTKTAVYYYPIYSNGTSQDGLYGYTNEAKIFEESITVSARGTIGFVCLRDEPYTPIVRLITLIPKYRIITAKYLYLWLKNINIYGTGTTQQQLTVPFFKKTKILTPTYKIVEDFTDIINPLYNKMNYNKKENEILSTLRDSLLPKLMSGEIDISKVNL